METLQLLGKIVKEGTALALLLAARRIAFTACKMTGRKKQVLFIE